MGKNKRTKSHSTAIPAVQHLMSYFTSFKEVSKISLGIINQCKPVRGNRRVKITKESGCYLLKVRDIASVQDLRIYATAEGFEKTLSEEILKLGYDLNKE